MAQFEDPWMPPQANPVEVWRQSQMDREAQAQKLIEGARQAWEFQQKQKAAQRAEEERKRQEAAAANFLRATQPTPTPPVIAAPGIPLSQNQLQGIASPPMTEGRLADALMRWGADTRDPSVMYKALAQKVELAKKAMEGKKPSTQMDVARLQAKTTILGLISRNAKLAEALLRNPKAQIDYDITPEEIRGAVGVQEEQQQQKDELRLLLAPLAIQLNAATQRGDMKTAESIRRQMMETVQRQIMVKQAPPGYNETYSMKDVQLPNGQTGVAQIGQHTGKVQFPQMPMEQPAPVTPAPEPMGANQPGSVDLSGVSAPGFVPPAEPAPVSDALTATGTPALPPSVGQPLMVPPKSGPKDQSGLSEKDKLRFATQWKGQFNQLTKRAQTINEVSRDLDGFVQMLMSEPNSTKAQEAAKVLWAKLTDPTTGVKQGEFDRDSSFKSAATAVENAVKRVALGESMTPRQVQDLASANQVFLNSGSRVFNEYKTHYESIYKLADPTGSLGQTFIQSAPGGSVASETPGIASPTVRPLVNRDDAFKRMEIK